MYHPVKCNTITRPKEEKGLGLRNLDIMNKAYLSKLGWKLYSGGEDLWCRAVWGKYGRENDTRNNTMKVTCSNFWKNIVKI